MSLSVKFRRRYLQSVKKKLDAARKRKQESKSGTKNPGKIYTPEGELLQDFTDWELLDSEDLAPNLDHLTADNVHLVRIWWQLGRNFMKPMHKLTPTLLNEILSMEVADNNVIKKVVADLLLADRDREAAPSSPQKPDTVINNNNNIDIEVKPTIINETTILLEEAKKFREIRGHNPRGRIHEEEKQLILKMSKQGMKSGEIAKQLKRGWHAVDRVIKQENN